VEILVGRWINNGGFKNELDKEINFEDNQDSAVWINFFPIMVFVYSEGKAGALHRTKVSHSPL
jgi:hypothetical protein